MRVFFSFPCSSRPVPLMLERQGMHSRAGAWEREERVNALIDQFQILCSTVCG